MRREDRVRVVDQRGRGSGVDSRGRPDRARLEEDDVVEAAPRRRLGGADGVDRPSVIETERRGVLGAGAVARVRLVQQVVARDRRVRGELARQAGPGPHELRLDPIAVQVEALPGLADGRRDLADLEAARRQAVGQRRPLRRAVPALLVREARCALLGPRRGDVLAPGVLVHVEHDIDALLARPRHCLADPVHVCLVEAAAFRLERRPVDQKADHVHAQRMDAGEVVARQRHGRRQRRALLPVVAQLVDVDAAQQHLPTVARDDRRAVAAHGVQARQGLRGGWDQARRQRRRDADGREAAHLW